MKIIVTIFLLFINLNSLVKNSDIKEYRYWENFSSSEKDKFISNHKINKLALEYYNGNLKITDDEKTFELLRVLTSSKSELIPFYYYLFNKICLNSDGTLSVALGKFCLNMIINNPDYVINHFTFERENVKRDEYLYQVYGNLLGYEMYFKKEGTSDIDYSFEQFKELLNQLFKDSTSQNKQTLNLFYKCISETMRKMSN